MFSFVVSFNFWTLLTSHLSRSCRNHGICFESVQSSHEDHSLWTAVSGKLRSPLQAFPRGLSQSRERLFCGLWFPTVWLTKGGLVRDMSHTPQLVWRKSRLDSIESFQKFTLRYALKLLSISLLYYALAAIFSIDPFKNIGSRLLDCRSFIPKQKRLLLQKKGTKKRFPQSPSCNIDNN